MHQGDATSPSYVSFQRSETGWRILLAGASSSLAQRGDPWLLDHLFFTIEEDFTKFGQRFGGAIAAFLHCLVSLRGSPC